MAILTGEELQTRIDEVSAVVSSLSDFLDSLDDQEAVADVISLRDDMNTQLEAIAELDTEADAEEINSTLGEIISNLSDASTQLTELEDLDGEEDVVAEIEDFVNQPTVLSVDADTDATDEDTDATDEDTDATDEDTDATDEDTDATDEDTDATDEDTDATDEDTDATDEDTEANLNQVNVLEGTDETLGDDPETEEVEEPLTYKFFEDDGGDSEYTYDGSVNAYLADYDGKIVIKLDGDFAGATFDETDEYAGVVTAAGNWIYFDTYNYDTEEEIEYEFVDADGSSIPLEEVQAYFDGDFTPEPVGPTLEEQLADLQAQLEDLQGQVEELTTSSEELNGQVEELTASNEELNGQVEELTASNEELSGQIEELTTAKETAEAAVDAAEAETQQLLDAIDALTDGENDVEDLAAALAALEVGLGGENEDPTAEVTIKEGASVAAGKTIGLDTVLDKVAIADVDGDKLTVKVDITGGMLVVEGAEADVASTTVAGYENVADLLDNLDIKADALAEGAESGTVGLTLTITDAHGGETVVDGLTLAVTAAPKVEEVALDGKGTDTASVELDASTGAFAFTDAIATGNNVVIKGFGADDTITFAGTDQAGFANISTISSDDTGVSIVTNSNGTLSKITLAGVTGFAFDVDSLENVLGTADTDNVLFG